MKDVQAKGEAFTPQKRTFSTSKNEIYSLFSIFASSLFPPADPDTQHRFKGTVSRDRF
jgi:hypothetical protein